MDYQTRTAILIEKSVIRLNLGKPGREQILAAARARLETLKVQS